MQQGVSDAPGNLTFHHMHDRGKQEWGFNSLRQRNAKGQIGIAEVVPMIRLASFLLEEIHGRQLPQVVYGNYSGKPKVVMKLDIEGMEYVTLPDLVTSGALCQTVDFCFGEFHPQWFFFPMNYSTTHGGLYLKNPQEGMAWGNSLVQALHSSQHCKTNYSMEDDESYLQDGIPFPTPPTTSDNHNTAKDNNMKSY